MSKKLYDLSLLLIAAQLADERRRAVYGPVSLLRIHSITAFPSLANSLNGDTFETINSLIFYSVDRRRVIYP